MTDTQLSRGDAASEARGADIPNEGVESMLGVTGEDTRPAFNFENSQSGNAVATTKQNTLKDKAIGRLQSEANNRKGVVSNQLKQVSAALGNVGGGNAGQGGETPAWLSNGVGQVTQLIDRVADNVENRDTAELVDDVRNFARTNPTLFLGACALIGFAAVRILSSAGDGR